MLTRLIFLVLFVSQVCRGLDFTFRAEDPAPSGKFPASAVCGVIQCTEKLSDVPHGDFTIAKKITALTIDKRFSGDGDEIEQWERLATLSPDSREIHGKTKGRRINGQILDKQASLQLYLVGDDCLSAQFSCAALFVDIGGQITLVGKKITPGYTANEAELPHAAVSYVNDRSSAGEKGQQLEASVVEKLKCIETRLEDFKRQDDDVKDSIRNLKDFVSDKIASIEDVVRDKLESSGNRIDDRLDRLENRLEDKVADASTGNLQKRTENKCTKEICSQVSSQFGEVINSVISVSEKLNSFENYLDKTEATASRSAEVTDEIHTKLSGLIPLVETLRNTYAGGALIPVEEFHDALSTGKKEWRLAFRGTAYNNVEIYPAYLYGTGIPLEVEVGCKQFNISLPCVNHYRNDDALDNWENVDQVLFAIYEKDQVVKQVVFDGEGTSYTGWFEVTRVVRSSWTDLTSLSHNIFSMEGEVNNREAIRRFFMNHIYSGCPGDKGWFFAGESKPGYCLFERKIAHPSFQYAKGNTVAVWQSSQAGKADAIGIYLKYK